MIRDCEYCKKLFNSFRFVEAEETAAKTESDLGQVNTELETVTQEVEDGEGEIKSIQARIEELQQKRDGELGGRLQELNEEASKKGSAVQSLENDIKVVKDNARQEEKKKAQIVKGMNSDQKHLTEKTKVAEGLQSTYDKLREEHDRCTAALKTAKERQEAIAVGKFAGEDGGKAETLQGQIIKLKNDISEAQTTVKANDMKSKHNEKEVRRMEAETKKSESAFARDQANLKKYEDQVAAAEQELGSLGYEEGLAERLDEEHRNLKHEVQGMGRRLDQMGGRFPWLEFQYSDPEKNFDRSQVKGVAANLITVKDPKFFQALDTVGGGKVSV